MTTTTTELQIVQVPIDELHPDAANPRKISDAELDALTRSLREFGFVQPVIARHDDHIVVGGHQRLVAARRIGLKTVPVIFVDLSPEQSHLLNLALNKISGDWDDQLLARMLADLQANAVDLEVSGFGADEINRLLKGLEAEEKRYAPWESDLAKAADRSVDLPRIERWIGLLDEYERLYDVFKQTRLVKGSTGQPVLNPLASFLLSLLAELRAAETELWDDAFGAAATRHHVRPGQ